METLLGLQAQYLLKKLNFCENRQNSHFFEIWSSFLKSNKISKNRFRVGVFSLYDAGLTIELPNFAWGAWLFISEQKRRKSLKKSQNLEARVVLPKPKFFQIAQFAPKMIYNNPL